MGEKIRFNLFFTSIYVLIFVFVNIMFGNNKSYGQKYSSEELEAKAKNSKITYEKIDVLNELCWENRLNNTEKAVKYGIQALKCSESLKFYNGSATAYINLAYIYTHKSKFNEAIDCYNKGMKTLDKIHDVKKKKIETARIYEGLGLINYMQHDYEKSVDSYQNALKIFKETASRNNMATCYHILGMIYDKSGDKNKANENYYQELKNTKKTNYANDSISAYLDFENVKDE